jgi:type II secretory pathway component PulK
MRYLLNNRGDAIIFVFGILAFLFLLTSTLLFLFSHWEKWSFNAFSGTQARYFAKAGIENAIWELRHDTNNYDGLDEQWHARFAGDDVDIDSDGAPESRWFQVKDSHGRLIGRYAVLVEDENGKANINAVSNISNNGRFSFHEGYRVAEIAFPENTLGQDLAAAVVRHRFGPDGMPGRRGVDDNRNAGTLSSNGIDDDGDGITDELDEGIDEPDEFSPAHPAGDDRPYHVIEDIKMVPGINNQRFSSIRNFISVVSYDLNIDAENFLRTNVNTATFEQLYSIMRDLGFAEKQAIQLALNIIDYRDADRIPTMRRASDGEIFYGLEKTPYLNEIEPVPKISISQYVSPAGIPVTVIEEDGPQFIELFNPYNEEIDIGGWAIKGGMILLPSANLQDVNSIAHQASGEIARGETILSNNVVNQEQQFWNSLSAGRIQLPANAKMAPLSYYVIGDSIRWKLTIYETPEGTLPFIELIPIQKPDNAQQYEKILLMNFTGCEIISRVLSFLTGSLSSGHLDSRISLLDKQGNTIEETNYGVDQPGALTRQKNDPRMRGAFDWFTFPATPGTRNACFLPSIHGEFNVASQFSEWPSSFKIKNHPFSSPAELSRIHMMRQWKTLNLWKGENRKLLDVFTVCADPRKPTFGRININTAPVQVLSGLPLVDSALAQKICNARPFHEISEITGIYGDALNLEITRQGFDIADNDNDGFCDTEDEKEMIIFALSNLITVRGNVFSIRVVGQKVQDTNNDGIITGSEIVAERRYRYIYDRITNRILERRAQ